MPDVRMEELDKEECHKLLAERHLGRLAIPDFGGPVIFPVNYVLDQDLVIFRTDPRIQAGCRHRARIGRLRGRRHRRGDPHRLERGRPWHPGRHHRPRSPRAAPRPAPVPLGPWREDPVRARAAALDDRPPHQDPRRPPLHLVGLTP